MKQHPVRIFLVGGTIILSSCNSKKKEHGERPSDKTKIERQSVNSAYPSSLNQVLQAGISRSPMTREDLDVLNRQVSSLSSKDLLQLLERTSKSRNSPPDRTLFQSAITEYAKREPENVMSWFDPGTMVKGEAGFIEASRVLVKSRPDVLQKWLANEMSKADRSVQNQCLNIGFSLLSSVNAKSAFEFAMSRKWDSIPTYEIANAIFADFGRQNPIEADHAAASRFTGMDLNLARNNIALGVAETDPDLAIQIAAKLTDPAERGMTTASILSTLMDSDKATALDKLQALDPLDLQATLQAFAGTFNSIVTKLGQSDPELLTTLLAKMTPSASNIAVFEAAVTALGGKNPEKSMDMIQSLPDSPMKIKLFSEHFSALVREDSQSALEAASALSDPNLRAKAYQSIGGFVGSKGWAETSKMLDSISSSDKASLLGSAAPFLANSNPKDFANLVSNGTVALEGDQKNYVLSMLGARLNSSDPSFAKSWLDGLPVEDQPSAMKGLAEDMAKVDVNQLANMLQSMKQDKKWEQGVKVLIDNIHETDPEMANQWKGVLKGAGYSD